MQSLSLLGNAAAVHRFIWELTKPQAIRNPDTDERITTKLFVIHGNGYCKSLRLYKKAVPLLQWIHPALYEHYMDLTYQHTFPGNRVHIERSHRVSESVAMLRSAGIQVQPYCLPQLQLSSIDKVISEPSFYSSREIKRVNAIEQNKTLFTRITGCILSPNGCFAVYNTRKFAMRWKGYGEWKAKAAILQIARMNAGVPNLDDAILFGASEQIAIDTLDSSFKTASKGNRITEVYDHIYFVPMDEFGVRLLRFLLVPDRNERLMSLLFRPEERSYNRGLVEYDAFVDGSYIYSHLECDIARLNRFRDGIASVPGNYTVLCYPHQLSFLRSFLGPKVVFRTMELDQLEEAFHLKGDSSP